MRNEDCISRTRTIERLRLNFPISEGADGSRDRYRYMQAMADIQAIKEMPSVTPQEPKTEWIPVSERLPDNTDPVSITWVNHDPESYYADIKDKSFTGTGHYCNGRWWWYSVTCQDYLDGYGRCDVDAMDDAIEVIAWMPLPKPYKAESDDKGQQP